MQLLFMYSVKDFGRYYNLDYLKRLSAISKSIVLQYSLILVVTGNKIKYN